MVMVAIVLFVIRPDVPTRVRLPDRVVVASPVRVVCSPRLSITPRRAHRGLAARMSGRRMLLPIPFLSDSYDPWLVLLSLGIAFVHTTIFELLFGCRSAGRIGDLGARSRGPARVSTSDGGGEASKSDSDESAADEPPGPNCRRDCWACIIGTSCDGSCRFSASWCCWTRWGGTRRPQLPARSSCRDEPPAEDDAD